MAEATETVLQPTTPANAISYADAAKRFHTQREAQGTNNPVSEAARTLGQRAGEALRARRAEAAKAAQEAKTDEVKADSAVEDDQPQPGEAQDEDTASNEPSAETEAEAKGESEKPQTIDLGDGVSVTLDEVRDGFMLKADYTRKTMDLGETRKAFEADRSQRLSLLDNAVLAAQQLLGSPKDPEALIDELGYEEGMKAYFRQVKQFETFGKVIQTRQQEQAQHIEGLKKSTIKELTATFGDKAEESFTKAAKYLSDKTGTDLRIVESMISHPEAVALVLDGMKHREIEAGKPKVAKMVAGKPPVIKPGAKVSAQASAQNNVQKAEANLKKSGSLADAVRMLRAQRGIRTG